ncbi:MAG: hypothetical protein CMJ23_15220, partial [Phycisphaerae bacterium]|nr:hypothetical protein [Phycisphaerae bacterium]
KVLREFWPYTQEGREEDSIDRLVPRAQIDPQRDGSLITADLNIAHTQWQAVYRRTDPTDFVKNILPEEEEEIVRAALTRGVVRTLATTTIDDLLRPQAGGTRAISQRALEVAQSTLDRMDAGITIEQFELGRKTGSTSKAGNSPRRPRVRGTHPPLRRHHRDGPGPTPKVDRVVSQGPRPDERRSNRCHHARSTHHLPAADQAAA